MYLEHFGLRADPFSPDTDPRAFHPTRHHTEALDFLTGAVRDGRPVAVLEGPAGVGKTLLLQVLADELPWPYRTVVVNAADAGAVGLDAALAGTLRLASPGDDGVTCGGAVGAWLASRLEAGERVVVAIDDAGRMPTAWADEVCELAAARPLPVRFVLTVASGGDGIAEGRLPEEAVRHRLAGIERAGLAGYLKARLMAAGAENTDLFGDAAVAVLWELTDGVPARVDAIAARALLVAFGSDSRTVDHEMVMRAAEQIAAGKRPPRPTVRPLPSREPRQDNEVVEVPRASAVGGGGRVAGAWRPTAAGPGRESPSRVSGASGPVVDETRVEEMPPGRPPVNPPSSDAAGGPRRTYRASADPQSEIGSLGRPEPEEPREWTPQRRPEDRSGGRPVPRAPAGNDPFRDAEPGEPPFGPEMLPVLSDPHGLAAEWFRVLRLRIEDWLEAVGGPPRALLVTSSHTGAGKTFVSANLALLFANQPGIGTLLVDADLRRPRFEALFGVPRRPGLADVLADRASVQDCIRESPQSGLSVVSAGRPGNPRDLMSPERLEAALEAMKQRADLVILDSPPLEPMADARSMASVVDGVMVVVRAGHTRAPALERSLQALSDARLVGTVITGVESSQAERAFAARGGRRRGRS